MCWCGSAPGMPRRLLVPWRRIGSRWPGSRVAEGESVAFVVATNAPDAVGMAAFGAGVPVLELALRRASLEQAFLDLTEGREQFKTGTDEVGGSA